MSKANPIEAIIQINQCVEVICTPPLPFEEFIAVRPF
jgi:hypothetical protein